jgi:hypothetical protein
MSTPLPLKIVRPGLSALWSAQNLGLDLTFTHISVGDSVGYQITGTETSLRSERIRAPISGGSRPQPDTLVVRSILSPEDNFPVRELGVWAGDKLFALWACPNADAKPLGYADEGIDWCITQALVLKELPIDGLNITFNADPNTAWIMELVNSHPKELNPHPQYTTANIVRDIFAELFGSTASDLRGHIEAEKPHAQYLVRSEIQKLIDDSIIAHVGQTNPHSQYTSLTEERVKALIEARVGDYVVATSTAANVFQVVLNPPITAYTPNTNFVARMGWANTGPVTIDAGGGPLALCRYDGSPMKAGDFVEQQSVVVLYDPVKNVFIAPNIGYASPTPTPNPTPNPNPNPNPTPNPNPNPNPTPPPTPVPTKAPQFTQGTGPFTFGYYFAGDAFDIPLNNYFSDDDTDRNRLSVVFDSATLPDWAVHRKMQDGTHWLQCIAPVDRKTFRIFFKVSDGVNTTPESLQLQILISKKRPVRVDGKPMRNTYPAPGGYWNTGDNSADPKVYLQRGVLHRVFLNAFYRDPDGVPLTYSIPNSSIPGMAVNGDIFEGSPTQTGSFLVRIQISNGFVSVFDDQLVNVI